MPRPASPLARLTDREPGTARRVVVALLAVRAAQAVSWPVAMVSSVPEAGLASVSAAWLVWGLGLVLAVVSGVAVVLSLRRRAPAWLALVEVFAVPVIVLAGGLVTRSGHGTDHFHPATAIAIGATITAALVLPLKQAVAAVAATSIAWVVGVGSTLALGLTALSSAAGVLAQLLGLPWLVALLVGVLAPSGRADRAEADLARLQARDAERTRQFRMLHDTVLSSLSALSRGSLDPRDPAVGQRLAADADHVRGLIATTESRVGMRLVGEMARLSREHAVHGLRLHTSLSDVPDDVPDEVVRAMVDALGEALTNVVKHSGQQAAWVTIVGSGGSGGSGGGVSVTVTDRGVGFDPAALPVGARRGLGLRHSLRDRMAEVGGIAEIDSAPEQGTSVELRWPA